MSRYVRPKRPVAVVNQPFFSRNFILIVVFITLFALAHLIQRNYIKEMLFGIANMQTRVDELVEENKLLQAKMFELSANDRIRKIAETRLHMIDRNRKANVVYYDDDSTVSSVEMLTDLLQLDNLAYQNPNTLIHSLGE